MSDVKRYDPINKDGTCGVCIEDADYGAYVEYADYAALEAELAKLRAGQEPVAYTTAGMLAIAKELPRTGRIGARCKADDRWNVPLYAAPATVHGDEYRCRKCGEKTPPPEPYKAYVLCDCGYITSATAAIAAARQEGGKV